MRIFGQVVMLVGFWSGAVLAQVAAVVGPGPGVYPDRLYIKLAEGTGARLQAGRLVSPTGVALGDVPALFATADAAPLVTAVSWDELTDWQRQAKAMFAPKAGPGHLGLWFRLQARDAATATALRERLAACPQVEHVYFEPRVSQSSWNGGGDPAPPTPALMAQQLHLGPAPAAISARWANGILGGRGQGVRVVMIENDWVIDHEDVSQLVASHFVTPVAASTSPSAMHGLGGVGELAADRNCFGVTGLVDEIDLRFSSYQTGGGVPNAVATAVANSQPGDVLMMVIQFLLGQLGPDDFVPVEYLQAEFDAVQTATGLGRIVVCSAANGFQDLDDPRHVRRFDRGFRDSGAIMVAASDGANPWRAAFSNHGSRIDANGWGENVMTTGYGTTFFGNNDYRQSYTDRYGGTSAATPMVTAAVVALQGAGRRQLGRTFTLSELRNLLTTHGTSSPDTIGRRPNLQAMFTALGIVDGLEVSEPDVALSGSVQVRMAGTGLAVLFTSFTTGTTPFGLNRPVHLGLSTLQTVGFFPLVGGTATWTLNVPNQAILHGTSLYFQAGRIDGGNPIHVTNSCQITVL
ncbi:MAG: S8 family serine peptidase [Planctomycetes bacterium]|nr:S8 family serine peptidase [Planctomycetota bacterium]